jgi:hypothetical protein
MGHQRWLPQSNVWCQKRELFDGTKQRKLEPEKMFKDQLLQLLMYVEGL